MKMTPKEYQDYVNRKSQNSPLLKNLVSAFFVGGAICCIGQALCSAYQAMGLGKEQSGTAVSITLVFFGALFTGLGLYDKLAKHAGAGTLVPITGFANAIVSPALEYRSEGLVMGVGAKMFTIAGPVLTYAAVSSAVYGVLLCIFSK